jgi:predicted nucleotidyltransferase component of viral defense system
MKNASAIRAKLLTIAKSENIAFQVIIFRYLHERFLFRLSKSDYCDNFILKGGNLIYAFEHVLTRPTKDVDFLGFSISNDLERIITIFKEITEINNEDTVWYNSETIKAESITELNKYAGVRLFIECGFDSIKQRIQIDIGFGDIVVPDVQTIDYPLLLPSMSPVLVKAYSKESVIAEKFHAIITLSYSNSRMKDFYDLYVLFTSNPIKQDILLESISATFKQRETIIVHTASFFEQEFKTDLKLNLLWNQFVKNNNMTIGVNFEEVVNLISQKIKPIWDTLIEKS